MYFVISVQVTLLYFVVYLVRANSGKQDCSIPLCILYTSHNYYKFTTTEHNIVVIIYWLTVIAVIGGEHFSGLEVLV
jgi:hypothetical protein